MSKFSAGIFTLLLCVAVSVPAWAQEKEPFMPSEPGRNPFVALTDGGVTVIVDDFGRSFSFAAGTGNVLFQHQDFISTGGPVLAVAPGAQANGTCVVTSPTFADTPGHATSEVVCNLAGQPPGLDNCTIDFDQTADGSSQSWITIAKIGGCSPACYYSYTDYDVPPFFADQGSYHLGGAHVVRSIFAPAVHFLFEDNSGVPTVPIGTGVRANHFQVAAFPSLLISLVTRPACLNLTDTVVSFGPGDWTGAFQWSYPPNSGGAQINYAHSRDDFVPFP